MTPGEPALADELVDRLVDGRYRVRRLLAHGGMGSVYVAVDTRLERDIALKVMRPDLARDASFVQRFRREARSAAQLTHPHVVAVYDQGEDRGTVFLAMELVTGSTLRERLSGSGALSPRESFAVLEKVLEALAAAHRAGLVHRDVKPENVLIADDGTVKVADFGLARAVSAHTTTTSSGTMLGTVAYLAPEQVERGIADARSDVYAAGLMLYEMLTGSKAFGGDSPIQVAYQHVHGTVPVPSERVPGLPHDVDALLSWATARDPDGRPGDAGVFLQRLRRVRARLSDDVLDRRPESRGAEGRSADTARISLPTRVVPVLPPTPQPGRRRRGNPPRPFTLTILTLLVAGLVLGWYLFLGPGSVRTVPPLTGQTEAVAAARLAEADLSSQVVEEFSDTIGDGRVISSDPAQGGEARRGTKVRLAVSKGPEQYPVPSVVGQDVEQATTSIQEASLRVAGTRERWHEELAAGKVMSTDPRTGTVLKPGSPVTLLVSKGKEPVALADWTGKPLAEMRKTLAAKDITVKQTAEEFHPTIRKGSVLSQSPEPTTINRGDTVEVVVSKGPDLIPVPTVRGMPEDEARRALVDAGFQVRVSRIAGGLFRTAHSTDPAGGGTAPRGGVVVLRIV